MNDKSFYPLDKSQNVPLTMLPYPEEEPDYTRSLTGEALLNQFFARYIIPKTYWEFWKIVKVIIDPALPYPAGMISETKTLMLKPEFANPGILAHEFSHLSYAQLTDAQKATFANAYVNAMQTEEIMRLLYSQKPYMKTSLVEAHAEIFRYLGNKMPTLLNPYYPQLI